MQTLSIWRRSLSKRAGRISTLIAALGLICWEGWLGRKSLFLVPDRRYQVTFALFVLLTAVLLIALMVIGEKARAAKDLSEVNQLKVWLAAVSFLTFVGFWTFTDYTASSFDSSSLVGTVIAAGALGIWQAASMKHSELEKNG